MPTHPKIHLRIAATILAGGAALGLGPLLSPSQDHSPGQGANMHLGKFSVSLAVKDLATSRRFYAKLGFEPVSGNPEQNWQVFRNGEVTIGLFQGILDGNILTFNPGWDAEKETLADFEDVREIQARLRDSGVELLHETDPDGTGIGHIVLADPDGNQIMIDQHVPAPSRLRSEE
jgi:catechol 2,3-dioxygenase-like lactoylglutathione lyase family enzyme